DDPAIGQDDLDAEDVVDRDAVLESVGPAGVGGDVSANGASALAGRVGGVVPAVGAEVVRQPQVDDAGLDDREGVAVGQFQDAFRPGKSKGHGSGNGERSAGEAGAGAAGQEGDVEALAKFDDHDDLFGGGGEDDNVGTVLLDGVAVALVDKQLAG